MSQTLPSDRVKELILSDTNQMRRAIALLAYSGLSLSDALKLDAFCLKDEPARLPGVGESRGLTYDQARRLLAVVEPGGSARDRCIIEMAMVCGLRQIELRRLRICDLTVDHRGRMHARVTGKGMRKRDVYVPTALRERLDTLVGDLKLRKRSHVWRPLFQNEDGGDLSESGMRWLIHGYLHQVAPDSTAHALRHTCVTWLLNTGATLDQAMEIVGHSEASSHELYAAADDGWYLRSWEEVQPMRGWWPTAGAGHIYVPGLPYDRRMARGTERAVPVPVPALEEIRRVFWEIGAPGKVLSKKGSSRIFDGVQHNPSLLRESMAAHMAERGGHPFLLSLVLGVTPGRVLDGRYHRRGAKAEDERVEALERAVRRLYERDDNAVDFGIRAR